MSKQQNWVKKLPNRSDSPANLSWQHDQKFHRRKDPRMDCYITVDLQWSLCMFHIDEVVNITIPGTTIL